MRRAGPSVHLPALALVLMASACLRGAPKAPRIYYPRRHVAALFGDSPRKEVQMNGRTGLPLIGMVLLLGGCASSHVMIGEARPPISPDQVKLYLHPPEKYEEIAIIDASSRHSIVFTDQQKMNKVIERLKEEAAKVGANGILIQGTGDEQAGEVSTGAGTATGSGHSSYGRGIGVSAGRIMKTGQGIAIYVPQP